MVEQGVIVALFFGAIYYLYQNFKAGFSKEGSACVKNCGSGACAVKSFEEAVPKSQ